MGAKIKTLLASVLIAVGILFFALGFAVKFAIFPQLLEEQIYANLDLKPDTEAYDGFVSQLNFSSLPTLLQLSIG